MRTALKSRNKGSTSLPMFAEEPEYRNFEALDLVVSELNAQVRAIGINSAQIDRAVLIEKALQTNIGRIEIEAAITYLVLAGQVQEKGGVLRFKMGTGVHQLPSQQRRLTSVVIQKRWRKQAY